MMLFDTPNLKIPSTTITSSSSTAAGPSNPSKKRKHSATASSSSSSSADPPPVNLDKLIKKLKVIEKDSGWGGELGSGGKTGVKAAEEAAQGPGKGKGKMKKRKEKREAARELGGAGGVGAGKKVQQEQGQKKKPHRFEPVKKVKVPKYERKRDEPSPASAANSIQPSTARVFEPAPASPPAPTPASHSRTFHAPSEQDSSAESLSTLAPQTALQKQLRAKLSGGKFRLLNETLYTTTGEEAWSTMKEEGAFDDYHTGFRSQSSHWPTNPLSIFTSTLSLLPPRTLIADFGCGDAQLARNLSSSGQKVISLDLVSKDGWVVEAECSSVPLPGGGKGAGEIIDVVVCCLSLMGTDWIKMVREARRVLILGGQLKIAEVASRFTDIDAFVSLITSVGFTFVSKDTNNTHFVLFDFVKSESSEEEKKKATMKTANDEKAKDLLKPCIYKRR